MAWSPDQKLVAFTGDWKLDMMDVDGYDSVYVAPVADTTAVRIARPNKTEGNMDAFRAAFSADGKQLVVWGDMASGNENDLFVTSDFTTADQALGTIQITSSPASGDVSRFPVFLP